MPTYKDIIKWKEDGFGEVVALFCVSDAYNGLFIDTSLMTEANIFEFSNVSKKLSGTVGGVVESELTIEIDEVYVNTTNEKNALAFVLEARSSANNRYCAVFINTSNTSNPLINDNLFYGLIQTDIESSDFRWSGSFYSSDVTPRSKWKMKAKPYSKVVFDNFELFDLIEGNSTKQIPGLQKDKDGIAVTTWSSGALIQPRGYFWEAAEEAGNYTHGCFEVYVDWLTNFNKLLRKLADNFCEAITNNNLGTLNITFSRSALDGRYTPARWKSFRWIEDQTQKCFAVYGLQVNQNINDYNELVIDPDGTPTDKETIWISWFLLSKCVSEPEPSAADALMFKRVKTFFEFIKYIGENFGCYVDFKWTNNETLDIKFIRRQEISVEKIYIKTATKSDTQYSNQAESGKTIYIGKANYAAAEGLDTFKGDANGYSETSKYKALTSNKNSNANYKDLLLTISPTMGIIGRDVVSLFGLCHIPHNHYIQEDGQRRNDDSYYGIHTAIYLRTEDWPVAGKLNFEPTGEAFWAPARAFTVQINGQDKCFNGLSDYLNTINNVDLSLIMVEKTIENPSFFGYSLDEQGNNPSWKHLQLGRYITLDGIDYVIVEIKWDLKSRSTTLKLNQSVRFDILSTAIPIVDTTDGSIDIISLETTDSVSTTYRLAYQNIVAYQVVSLRSDDKVEVSVANSTHYNRIFGIALNSATEGANVSIQTKGNLTIPSNWEDLTPSQILYLRTFDSTSNNISSNILKGKSTTEDLFCIVAKAIDKRTIDIMSNFHVQGIYNVTYGGS